MASCSNEESLEYPPVEIENVEFTDAELVALFQMRGNDHKVDMSEATKFANDVISFLDGDVSTRTASPRKIGSVSALTSEDMEKIVTRTFDGETVEIPDTIAYLFNFEDNSGYAIVSGDKRINAPILGYCTEGSLTEGIDNPGLIGIMADIESYVLVSIANYENQIDSITNDILNKIIGDSASTRALAENQHLYLMYEMDIQEMDNYTYTPPLPTTTTSTTTTVGNWVITGQVKPLLPVEWGQDFPFNHRVKNFNGCTNAQTGCVATALAQLLTYWQYPSAIDGHSYDWPLLRRYTARLDAYPNVANKNIYNTIASLYPQNYKSTDEIKFVSEVSLLMQIIGAKVKMDYGDIGKGSGAKSEDAMFYLTLLGYSRLNSLVDYNYNKVIQSLNNGCPVYARGNSEKIQHRIKLLGLTIGTWSEYGEGHAWVIDGYLNRRKATNVQITVRNRSTGAIVSQTTTTTYSYADYLHHNWGWSGNYSNYIVAGSYDAYDEDHLSSDTRATITYDPYNFQFLKEICVNIRPF